MYLSKGQRIEFDVREHVLALVWGGRKISNNNSLNFVRHNRGYS